MRRFPILLVRFPILLVLILFNVSFALLGDITFSPVEDPPKIGQAELSYIATGTIDVDGSVSNLNIEVRAVPQVCDDPSITYGEIKSDDMGTYLEQVYPSRTADVVWNIICGFEQSSEILELPNISPFPFAGQYPDNVTSYLEFTSLVDTNDDIARTASEIASGSRTNK